MRISNIRRIAVVTILAIALGACQMNKETMGMLGGASLGGLVGSMFGSGSGKLVGVALGTVIGGYAGKNIGASLDRADQASINQNFNHAMNRAPTGQSVAWQNPQKQVSQRVTPRSNAYRHANTVCREFVVDAVIGGKAQQVYGTACRQPDGSWKIVNSQEASAAGANFAPAAVSAPAVPAVTDYTVHAVSSPTTNEQRITNALLELDSKKKGRMVRWIGVGGQGGKVIRSGKEHVSGYGDCSKFSLNEGTWSVTDRRFSRGSAVTLCSKGGKKYLF